MVKINDECVIAVSCTGLAGRVAIVRDIQRSEKYPTVVVCALEDPSTGVWFAMQRWQLRPVIPGEVMLQDATGARWAIPA